MVTKFYLSQVNPELKHSCCSVRQGVQKQHAPENMNIFPCRFAQLTVLLKFLFGRKPLVFRCCCSNLSMQFEADQRASKQPSSAANSLEICRCVMGVTSR